MKFVDLEWQFQEIRAELIPDVESVLSSGNYVSGKRVEEFERDFGTFTQQENVIAVNSGTSALHAALISAGVQPGDEVITVSNTFIATIAAIVLAGATPTFVDVNQEDGLLNASLLDSAYTERTKFVLPVHLYGHMCDMKKISQWALTRGVKIIEDAAQAHGATRDGITPGLVSEAACYSFYPGKNLGAAGEAGALTSHSSALAQNARLFRDWGAPQKYEHESFGLNYRMDELQAVILSHKLRKLKLWNSRRTQIAELYEELLPTRISRFASMEGSAHHLYPIFAKNREYVLGELRQRGVPAQMHYPIPVHRQKWVVDKFPNSNFDLPVTQRIANEVVTLPIHPGLTDTEVRRIVEALSEVIP